MIETIEPNKFGEKVVNHLKNLGWVKEIKRRGFFGAFWDELKDPETQKLIMTCFIVALGFFYFGAKVNCSSLGGVFVLDDKLGFGFHCYNWELFEPDFEGFSILNISVFNMSEVVNYGEMS